MRKPIKKGENMEPSPVRQNQKHFTHLKLGERKNYHEIRKTEEYDGQDTIIGFGDVDEDGFLHRLYVHKDYQRRSVATALCHALEKSVKGHTLTVHASVTAKSFFEKHGYTIVKEQQVERAGVFLTNYVMEKRD